MKPVYLEDNAKELKMYMFLHEGFETPLQWEVCISQFSISKHTKQISIELSLLRACLMDLILVHVCPT